MRALRITRVVGLLMVFGALVLGLVFQRAEISRLNSRATELTDELAAARQSSGTEQSATATSAIQPSDAEVTQRELLQLRNEVTQLKAETKELQRLRSENLNLRNYARELQKRAANSPPSIPEAVPPLNAWVGIQIQIQPAAENTEGGRVMVGAVFENSPAAEAKLQPGDLVLAVNGETITNLLHLRTRLGSSIVGQPLIFDLLRDNTPMQVTVIPTTPPPNLER